VTETFQISLEQATAYDALFVPAIFGEWAPRLVDLAGLRPGQRILDVACGTGVVARTAVERVGDPALVVGVDLNPAMLQVAARVRPDLDWRQGDAGALPFDEAAFDAVLCQSALFFFPDPAAAIAEMARVTAIGGVVAIQTYAGLDAQPGYGILADIVARHAGESARALLNTYFSQGDLPSLCAMFEAAGLGVEETRTRVGTARYGSIELLVDIEVKGTPLVDRMSEDQMDRVLADCRGELSAYRTPDGGLAMPIRGHLVAGRALS